MAKLKELGNTIGTEEKERIMEEFRGRLLDFCESVIPNGSRRGEEWDCSDIFNGELEEGDRGSCSVNLRTGKFKDQNEGADVKSGGPYTLFSAITGLKGAKAYRAMRQWNEDRTLPDGTKGARSDRKVELEEGSTIEATDEFEKDRVSWIGTFQDWKNHAIENGLGYKPGCGYKLMDGAGKEVDTSPAAEAAYIPEQTARNDNRIAWAVTDIYTRRWLQAVEFTQDSTIREKFAGELAEMRGLSREVFLWLIDSGNLACLYERKETPQPAMTTDEGVWEEPPPIVREYFNIAFPVYRDLTVDDWIPEWAGSRDFIDPGNPHWKAREEMKKNGEPVVLFHGMHIPWTDKHGKKHWRYDPKGCPSQPWIIGDVSTADLVVIAESTWDAIAYLDLRKLWTWKEYNWAVIATRGSSNAQRLPAALIKQGAMFVRLLQNDAGNAAWVASLPLMPQAEHQEISPPRGINGVRRGDVVLGQYPWTNKLSPL
jgi:hypothetical protein